MFRVINYIYYVFGLFAQVLFQKGFILTKISELIED